jgi:hypothetical protein
MSLNSLSAMMSERSRAIERDRREADRLALAFVAGAIMSALTILAFIVVGLI